MDRRDFFGVLATPLLRPLVPVVPMAQRPIHTARFVSAQAVVFHACNVKVGGVDLYAGDRKLQPGDVVLNTDPLSFVVSWP